MRDFELEALEQIRNTDFFEIHTVDPTGEFDPFWQENPQRLGSLIAWLFARGELFTVQDAIHVLDKPHLYAADWVRMCKEADDES